MCTSAHRADDQDQMLGGSFPEIGGVGPMPQTKAILAEAGSTALNFYIHTPICCPSRSELLSGRYLHNIKSSDGSGCMHVNESLVNSDTFAKYLKEEAGYTVGMFGKYLNNMPPGKDFVPPGFDAWMANGGGNYINPQFDTMNLEFLEPKMHVPNGRNTHVGNYSTSIIGNVSIAWIESVVTKNSSQPFFAYIGPKAAHEPFNPAPWYEGHWDPAWPAQEPRPAPWNSSVASRADHHGQIALAPMIDEAGAKVITDVFKNRWRTLMSVDDVIAEVFKTCEALGVADNTYFFYSSDHGFQVRAGAAPTSDTRAASFRCRDSPSRALLPPLSSLVLSLSLSLSPAHSLASLTFSWTSATCTSGTPKFTSSRAARVSKPARRGPSRQLKSTSRPRSWALRVSRSRRTSTARASPRCC